MVKVNMKLLILLSVSRSLSCRRRSEFPHNPIRDGLLWQYDYSLITLNNFPVESNKWLAERRG